MEETEMLERIATAVAKKLSPVQGAERMELWDISEIASFLKREPRVVRERIACLPDFPRAIRLPSGKSRGHPLYIASEVIAWAKAYQERAAKRP